MILVRPAIIEDADELAPRLRAADVQEIKANLGEPPLIVLESGIASSDPCYAAVNEEDKVLALFGVVPDSRTDDVGMIWLLGSNELLTHSVYFLRHCRKWVEKLHEQYRVLWNYVDARNEIHIRWLKWCDFTVLELIERHGVEQRPFYEFTKERGQNSFADAVKRQNV